MPPQKTQMQALDRSQPLLPLRPGQAERRTHDYVRHGRTSLFAVLEVKSGRVLGDFHARHRAVEFRKFLDRLEEAVPAALDVHLILDNYGTHKPPLVHRWLLRHPRFHVHFTPTRASWLNLVERWFAAADGKTASPGSPSFHAGTGTSRPPLHRNHQRAPHTLRQDKNRRRNPDQPLPLLYAYF
jgi:DDE superfamily endonuclease